MQLSEQEVVRREKLSKLRELGINPYPADLFPINSNSTTIKEEYVEKAIAFLFVLRDTS